MHSALLVGLDRAKIIGLALKSAIRFNIAGVNAPPVMQLGFFVLFV